ncbi:MAG: type IV pilus modification PilV family protein [Ilumatobacteraceae bacterium]
MNVRTTTDRDDGTVLPIVLVSLVVFTLIVIGVARLTMTGLRYGAVVEQRADLLAAADGGMRFGVERLRNFEDLCTTGVGAGGLTTSFPPRINDADTVVTCRRVGASISDMQGWGVMVTGSNVPSDQDLFVVQGAGGSSKEEKRLRGPVYIADPNRIDLRADLIIEDGDLWYTVSDCTSPPFVGDDALTFDPDFLRGPSCSELPWTALFSPPTADVPTADALMTAAPPDDFSFNGCRVFNPGRYVGPLELADGNYFRSGDYYFEDVDLELFDRTAVFGFPSGSGDVQRVSLDSGCQAALDYDRVNSGERGGATIWLGGDSKITVDTGGELEIFRRFHAEAYLSIVVVEANGIGFRPSTNSYLASSSIDWILETKSGNTNDTAVHGIIWAPHSKITLGNVTNAAVGQLIGGVAVAQLDVQASASAEEFAIGVEGTPIETVLVLESTAVSEGLSTTIRAVVQFRPDSRQLAVKSWRVVD